MIGVFHGGKHGRFSNRNQQRHTDGRRRDRYARELETPFPNECIVCHSDFPWHETGYTTPRFNEVVIYQLHVGTFFTPRLPAKGGTFLDVAAKLPYLAELGITAIQLLPIQEFLTEFSQGYNGTDYFSPEMDYAVSDDALPDYFPAINQQLAGKGLQAYSRDDLRGVQPRRRRVWRRKQVLLRPSGLDRRSQSFAVFLQYWACRRASASPRYATF